MSRPAASPLASFLRSTSPPPVPQPGAWRASRKKDGAAEQGRGDGRWRRHLAGVLGEEEPVSTRGRRAPVGAAGRRWRLCSRQRRQLPEIRLCLLRLRVPQPCPARLRCGCDELVHHLHPEGPPYHEALQSYSFYNLHACTFYSKSKLCRQGFSIILICLSKWNLFDASQVLPYGATMARFTTTCSFKDGCNKHYVTA